MEKECWIWYHEGAFGWEVRVVYTDKDKLVDRINEDWGIEIDYETMMDSDWQDEAETRITKSILYE